MTVALPALRRPTAAAMNHGLEARWALYPLYLTAVSVGFLSGHLVTGTLLGAAILTQVLMRRRFHPAPQSWLRRSDRAK